MKRYGNNQQRKNGAGMYLLEVRLVVRSLQQALANFEN
jgi:hypothetical protein